MKKWEEPNTYTHTDSYHKNDCIENLMRPVQTVRCQIKCLNTATAYIISTTYVVFDGNFMNVTVRVNE